MRSEARRAAIFLGGVVALMFGANFVGAALNRVFLAWPGIDKIIHFVFHAGVFVLARRASALLGIPARRRDGFAAALGVSLSLADELVQSLTYTRSVEGEDLVAGWAGIAFAWGVTSGLRPLAAVAAIATSLLAGGTVAYQTYARLRPFSIGAQYEREHDFARAREYYLQALAGGLRTATLLNALGWVEIESGHGDAEQAVAWTREALSMQPGNPDILDTYGWALEQAGRPTEALAPLLEALRRKPDIYCIHYHLGAVYRSLNRLPEARHHFTRQLMLPDTREADLARLALDELAAASR